MFPLLIFLRIWDTLGYILSKTFFVLGELSKDSLGIGKDTMPVPLSAAASLLDMTAPLSVLL